MKSTTSPRLEDAAPRADVEALRAIAADPTQPERDRKTARRLAVRFDRARRNPAGPHPGRTEEQMRADSAPTGPETIPGYHWRCDWCEYAVNGPEIVRCAVCHRHPDEWRCRCGWSNDPSNWNCARRGCGEARP